MDKGWAVAAAQESDMKTTVVNKHVDRGDIYIGRLNGMPHFGNPFAHKQGTLATVLVGSRQEAIERFRFWLAGQTDQNLEPLRRAWILANLYRLQGKRLECFCKPAACHGDVLAEMADRP